MSKALKTLVKKQIDIFNEKLQFAIDHGWGGAKWSFDSLVIVPEVMKNFQDRGFKISRHHDDLQIVICPQAPFPSREASRKARRPWFKPIDAACFVRLAEAQQIRILDGAIRKMCQQGNTNAENPCGRVFPGVVVLFRKEGFEVTDKEIVVAGGSVDDYVSEVVNDEEIDENDNTATTCVVCLQYRRSCLWTGCNHFATCMKCSKKLGNCPICRQKSSFRRVYVS